MAAKPGEENVATLFADVHYFYSAPEVKPCHHRFDKGSYVYLFENAGERRCRLEIANNPGTDEQDAFEGFLDQTCVRYSYRQHCMVTIIVAEAVPQVQWHLPTYDPRNETKYLYKLHSLDIYFWTQQDALHFINAIRRVLPAVQVEVLDEPAPAPPPTGMSAVVQRLEKAAISDPKYKNDRASIHSTHSVSRNSIGSVASQAETRASSGAPAPAAVTGTLPPPPPPPNFTPMAYNPAAPAAPETIRHREKTPPPDEDPLNPVAVAVAYDYHRQPFTPGVPPATPGFPSQFAPPPVHPGIHRAVTVQGVMPSSGLAGGTYGTGMNPASGLVPPPPQHPASATPQHQSQQQHMPQHIPQHIPQQHTPPQHILPQHVPQQHTPQQHTLPQHLPPQHHQAPQQHQQQQQMLPGGFSTYVYEPAAHGQQGLTDQSIHQQLYRPTEEEAAVGHKVPSYQPKPEGRGRLENAERFERGVTGMLKKFEKKFG